MRPAPCDRNFNDTFIEPSLVASLPCEGRSELPAWAQREQKVLDPGPSHELWKLGSPHVPSIFLFLYSFPNRIRCRGQLSVGVTLMEAM